MIQDSKTGNASYIGDGVYADFDGHSITMTTENGVSVGNVIVLDPYTIAGLLRYIDRLQALHESCSPLVLPKG